MMKFLLIIIIFISSILNSSDSNNVINMDVSKENEKDEVIVQTIEKNTNEIEEETNDDTGIEEKVEQVQVEIAQEPIQTFDNIQQRQEPVYIPEETIIQEQPVQETIQEPQEIQQEESTYIVNQFEENLPMEIPEKTEEYRYNAEMTQKMIDMINNNQNENMIEYGYEVVVDSSAKEKTNPFTYTDERMLIKIQRRCGTIHVYAEDYYLNGNFFGTDCYIY